MTVVPRVLKARPALPPRAGVILRGRLFLERSGRRIDLGLPARTEWRAPVRFMPAIHASAALEGVLTREQLAQFKAEVESAVAETNERMQAALRGKGINVAYRIVPDRGFGRQTHSVAGDFSTFKVYVRTHRLEYGDLLRDAQRPVARRIVKAHFGIAERRLREIATRYNASVRAAVRAAA